MQRAPLPLPAAALACLALGLAITTAASAQRARDARGQLSLTYTTFERGVAHVSSVRTLLDVELARAPGRRAELRVRGTLTRSSAFLVPPGEMWDQGTIDVEIDETHRGEIVSDDAGPEHGSQVQLLPARPREPDTGSPRRRR